MLNTLKARLQQGYKTGSFPKTEPTLPTHFLGRPVLASDLSIAEAQAAAAVCPTQAIRTEGTTPALDTGRCIFCGQCAKVCPKITFSKQHRLATTSREALIVHPGDPAPPAFTPPTDCQKLCRRSFKIRQVSAGGCAACELDFNVLGTLAWDFGRFGIQVVASPRHADAILVTGPITDNMRLALQKTYAAMPRPNWVIACGTCAISGGLFEGNSPVHNGLESILKPDLYVPGCPPHPTTLLEGLLHFIGRI